MNLRYVERNGEKVLQQKIIGHFFEDGSCIVSDRILTEIGCKEIKTTWQDVPTVSEE